MLLTHWIGLNQNSQIYRQLETLQSTSGLTFSTMKSCCTSKVETAHGLGMLVPGEQDKLMICFLLLHWCVLRTVYSVLS